MDKDQKKTRERKIETRNKIRMLLSDLSKKGEAGSAIDKRRFARQHE